MLNRAHIVALAMLLPASVAGAQTRGGAPAAPPQDSRIVALESQIKKLQSDLAEVKSDADITRAVANSADERTPPTAWVMLDCANGKYQQIQTKTGYSVFFVKCTKIEPYLEGYRVTVGIGNPYGIPFTDFSGQLGYGETYGKAVSHPATMSSTAVFTAQAWTSVVVTLNPATAKDVRTIVLVEMDFAGMRMAPAQ